MSFRATKKTRGACELLFITTGRKFAFRLEWLIVAAQVISSLSFPYGSILKEKKCPCALEFVKVVAPS